MLNLLFTPFLVRTLTLEVFGLLVILNGILGYLTIVDFSFRDALIKYIAESCAKNQLAEANETFNSVLVFQFLLGVICTIFLVYAESSVLGLFKVSAELSGNAHKSYLIMCIGFPISLISGLYASFPVAMQRFDVSSLISTATGCANIIGSIAIVALGYNIPEIMLWNVGVLVVSCGVYHFWIKGTYPWYRFTLVLNKNIFRRLFSFSVFSQLAKSASIVNDQLLRIIVGSLAGASAVTYYSVPLRLINGLQGLIDKITRVMFPLASELGAAREFGALKQNYLFVAKYLCVLVTPVYLVIALFARDILNIWMGPEFADRSWIVLTLSTLTYYFVFWTMVPSNIALGLGKVKINAFFSVVVGAANAVLTYVLCHKYGITGAASAVLITQVQTPLFVVLVSNYIEQGFGLRLLREAYLAPCLCGIVIFGAGLLFLSTVKIAGFRVLLGVCLVACYYVTIVACGILPFADIKRLRTAFST